MKAFKCLAVILLVSLSSNIKAQIIFQKFVDTLGIFNSLNSVQQTLDHGYIIAGSHYSTGNPSIKQLLIKLDENGDTLWTRTYSKPLISSATSIQQTNDSGYIVGGIEYDPNTNDSGFINIFKTDPNGAVLWIKSFGPRSSALYGAHVICRQTFDGGYILASTVDSSSLSSMILIKTDNSGDTLWTKRFDRSALVQLYDFKITIDSGFILVGSNGIGIFLIKTDTFGNITWDKQFAGGAVRSKIDQTYDGGFIISSNGRTSAQNEQLEIVRTDSAGNFLWAKNYGDSALRQSSYCVRQTRDSGIVVVGEIRNLTTLKSEIILLKTDRNGDTLWTRSYSGDNNQAGMFVQQTDDDGFIIVGSVTDSIPNFFSYSYIIKTDSSGNAECFRNHPLIDTRNFTIADSIYNFLIFSGLNISSRSINTESGVSFTSVCGLQSINENYSKNSILISPNPSNGNFTISTGKLINNGRILVYNILGEKIFEKCIQHTSEKEINMMNFMAGIYVIVLEDGVKQFIKKIVLQE